MDDLGSSVLGFSNRGESWKKRKNFFFSVLKIGPTSSNLFPGGGVRIRVLGV